MMTPSKLDGIVIPASPDLTCENRLWGKGVRIVAGIDEVGRGALAGPVAAAALVLTPEPNLCQKLAGVRDSKVMTPAARQYWADCLQNISMAFGVGFASHQEIDEMGIVPATRLAVLRALQKLPEYPQHLLIDYFSMPELTVPQTSLVKGDARSLSIAGASILAKTARDDLLCKLDQLYPGYCFAAHKGYGTPAHRCAIIKLGPSPIHRRSFRLKSLDI
jgi:ribonuclease HII